MADTGLRFSVQLEDCDFCSFDSFFFIINAYRKNCKDHSYAFIKSNVPELYQIFNELGATKKKKSNLSVVCLVLAFPTECCFKTLRFPKDCQLEVHWLGFSGSVQFFYFEVWTASSGLDTFLFLQNLKTHTKEKWLQNKPHSRFKVFVPNLYRSQNCKVLTVHWWV